MKNLRTNINRKPVIEVDRVRLLSPFSGAYASWCAGCGEDVEMVKIDEAAAISGTSAESVINRAAGGEIHLGIRPEALLFCVKSLLKQESIPVSIPAFNGTPASAGKRRITT